MLKFNSFSKASSFIFLSVALTFSFSHSAIAKPNLQPLGENIADIGSKYYQFQIKEFKSTDQQRNYKVWLGIPKQINRQQAQPSIFMLDGNSVMSRLNEPLLKEMTEQQAPVLVAIGYRTNLPFESNSRSLDYTPADQTGKPSIDPRNAERMSGGSEAFRKVILEQITPWVSSQVKLDPNRKALWGHSYGGLFVLDSMLTADSFSHYFSASPSLTWADQRMLKKISNTAVTSVKTKQLLLMEGDMSLQQTAKVSPNFDSAMIQNNRQVISDLNKQGVKAKFLIYPNLSHGEVFGASLMDVLSNRLF